MRALSARRGSVHESIYGLEISTVCLKAHFENFVCPSQLRHHFVVFEKLRKENNKCLRRRMIRL